MPLSLEQPLYEVHQHQKRALLPKIISLLVLGLIFYLGILLNLALLELRAAQESGVKIVTLLVLLLLVTLGIVLAVHHASLPFTFYRDRIVQNKKERAYLNIINTSPQQDIWDKLFHTYSINLGNHFHLRHIPQEISLQPYLQELISYAKKNKITPEPTSTSQV